MTTDDWTGAIALNGHGDRGSWNHSAGWWVGFGLEDATECHIRQEVDLGGQSTVRV